MLYVVACQNENIIMGILFFEISAEIPRNYIVLPRDDVITIIYTI